MNKSQVAACLLVMISGPGADGGGAGGGSLAMAVVVMG